MSLGYECVRACMGPVCVRVRKGRVSVCLRACVYGACVCACAFGWSVFVYACVRMRVCVSVYMLEMTAIIK